MEAAMKAKELIEAGSAHHERRIRELIRQRKRIGHGFAFWICGDYYATKNGNTVRLFHAPTGNSKPEKSRFVYQTSDLAGLGYASIAEALERDAI